MAIVQTVDHLVVAYHTTTNDALLRYEADLLQRQGKRVWTATFRDLHAAELPPGGRAVCVHPIMMESGTVSGRLLPQKIRAWYEMRGRAVPPLAQLPVWGVSPGVLNDAVIDALHVALRGDSALLLVAHGVKSGMTPPEPEQCLRRLQKRFAGVPMGLAYFGGGGLNAVQVMPRLAARHVVALPFLIGSGRHMQNDMPTEDEAAACGKTLRVLAPLGELFLRGV